MLILTIKCGYLCNQHFLIIDIIIPNYAKMAEMLTIRIFFISAVINVTSQSQTA